MGIYCGATSGIVIVMPHITNECNLIEEAVCSLRFIIVIESD